MVVVSVSRTQEEIVDRIHEVKGVDFFAAISNELLTGLDFEHAKEFLKDDATAEQWAQAGYPYGSDKLRSEARAYLEFAVGKAVNHRGLSAARSVDHYRGWVWLLAPERYDELEATDYAQYGAPQLKIAATILGFPEEWDRLVATSPEVALMAEGSPCEPGCDSGCGL